MSDQDDFDARLAERFAQENTHLPEDAFVAHAMRQVRVQRRRARMLGTALRVAALLAIIIASPWLIAGSERLSATLQSALEWTMGRGAPVLGVLAIAVLLLAARMRSR